MTRPARARRYTARVVTGREHGDENERMACSIASIIGRPCRYVVDAYDRDRGQGWGNIAKQMGIKPGSPEFHRLKQGFVPVYDRWSRPIVLDTELQRAYPNHGNGKSKSKGKGYESYQGDDDHGNGHDCPARASTLA